MDNQFAQLTRREGVIQTIAMGRVSVGMPARGGVRTDAEIGRLADHIRALKKKAENLALTP